MICAVYDVVLLKKAYLCIDCESLSECSTICPACSSLNVHPLASWLNRDENKGQPESRPNPF